MFYLIFTNGLLWFFYTRSELLGNLLRIYYTFKFKICLLCCASKLPKQYPCLLLLDTHLRRIIEIDGIVFSCVWVFFHDLRVDSLHLSVVSQYLYCTKLAFYRPVSLLTRNTDPSTTKHPTLLYHPYTSIYFRSISYWLLEFAITVHIDWLPEKIKWSMSHKCMWQCMCEVIYFWCCWYFGHMGMIDKYTIHTQLHIKYNKKNLSSREVFLHYIQ